MPARHPSVRPSVTTRWRDDRGEGVISSAIAVLVVAFLGALMWVGFQQLWTTAEARTNEQIEQIGG